MLFALRWLPALLVLAKTPAGPHMLQGGPSTGARKAPVLLPTVQIAEGPAGTLGAAWLSPAPAHAWCAHALGFGRIWTCAGAGGGETAGEIPRGAASRFPGALLSGGGALRASRSLWQEADNACHRGCCWPGTTLPAAQVTPPSLNPFNEMGGKQPGPREAGSCVR